MSKDQKEICLYCKWWVFHGYRHDENEDILKIQEGVCHRKSPDRFGGNQCPTNTAFWPETRGGDFCGEFQERRDDSE